MSEQSSISDSVTALLHRIDSESDSPGEELVDRVHEVLRSIATSHIRHEKIGNPGVTEIVNQAYLRIFGKGSTNFENRRHFFAAFNTAVSRLLIERGRRRAVERRALSKMKQSLSGLEAGRVAHHEDLCDLARAFPVLESRDPRAAEVARLKCLSGVADDEIADMLGISPRTVQRDWLYARSFLLREMDSGERGDGGIET